MAIKFCLPTATGSNNGTTWKNAYTSFQAAHDACGAGDDSKYEVMGVAKATISSGNPVEIISIGPADVLTGATAGTRYYLDDGGGLTTSIPVGQKWVVVVGFAVDADTLFVMPKVLHKQYA